MLLLLLVGSRGGYANELRDEARLHSDLGKLAFKQQRYADALAEFRRAYELAPIPEVLFNVARCHEELHDDAAAVRGYEQYLAARPDAPDRVELEEHLRTLRARVASAPPPTAKPPPPEPAPTVAPTVAPTASPTTMATAPAPVARGRRGLWIGLGVGAGIVVAGAVTLGLVLGLSGTEPFRGNISPGFTQVTP